MDISDISKVASRKRMNTDAEKLREKVSRETAKIIKLKVAQDTAYWDLKEKLQQLEGNHERLQQNMVEVQMQHEAVSGQYQQELRMRPDTLNRLNGTRKICDVLEEYGERLRRSVARCRSDQQALGEAYGACGARVRRLAAEGALQRAAATEQRAAAKEASQRHDADARRLALALEQLGTERARGDSLEVARRELAERLDRCTTELRQREESTATLQADVARLLKQLDEQNSELKRTISGRDRELQEIRERIDAIRKCMEATEENAAALQIQLKTANERIERLCAEGVEADAMIDKLRNEIASLDDCKKGLEVVIDDRNKSITKMETEANHLKDQLSYVEAERQNLREQLDVALNNCESLTQRTEELTRIVDKLQAEITEAKATYETELSKLQAELNEARVMVETQRAADARKVEELTVAIADRDRELDNKTRTITRLMTDLKTEAEARARSDTTLATTRKQFETEREASRKQYEMERDTIVKQYEAERDALRKQLEAEREAAASRQRELEAAVRAKDDELGAQMNIILNTRAEKERLQERIAGMQATIDNIQKELTGRIPPPPPPAERDVMPKPTNERKRDFIPKQSAPDSDMLYSFLSDGSVDGDTLDVREVGRRFEALARGDLPLHAMRPTSHGPMSLSQVKKDLKMKSRTFFKNKRLETKAKKIKE